MPEPRFTIGQLVKHTRHTYRGVVYEVNIRGSTHDEWQDPSLSFEQKEMAWYRILVHGAQHSTFLPEYELEEDDGGEQVMNPRVKDIFESFSGGRYQPRII